MRRAFAWWIIGAAALATMGLALWSVFRPEPLREYVPWCGGFRHPMPIEGEVRERFMLLMSQVFDDFGIERVMREGRMFLRGEGFSDGHRWSQAEVERNFQHRVVGAIAEGVTIDDVFFPPPAALIEAIRASEAAYGPYPRRDEQGRRIFGADPRFEDCEIMRAGILKQP